MWGCGRCSSALGYWPVAGSCEHGNEFSGSMKDGKSLARWVTTSFLRKLLVQLVLMPILATYQLLFYLGEPSGLKHCPEKGPQTHTMSLLFNRYVDRVFYLYAVPSPVPSIIHVLLAILSALMLSLCVLRIALVPLSALQLVLSSELCRIEQPYISMSPVAVC
jgi:hypothetical protein